LAQTGIISDFIFKRIDDLAGLPGKDMFGGNKARG
jgi:hypothetical protein